MRTLCCTNFYPDEGSEIESEIFFWVGKEATKDTYSKAILKADELDELLGASCVVHRETQENESKDFLRLFSGNIIYLKGGFHSRRIGFKVFGSHDGGESTDNGRDDSEKHKHVEDPIFLHVKGSRGALVLREVDRRRDMMNSGDVFILVNFKEKLIYQWNGTYSKCARKN